jgi:hypothetical protein
MVQLTILGSQMTDTAMGLHPPCYVRLFGKFRSWCNLFPFLCVSLSLPVPPSPQLSEEQSHLIFVLGCVFNTFSIPPPPPSLVTGNPYSSVFSRHALKWTRHEGDFCESRAGQVEAPDCKVKLLGICVWNREARKEASFILYKVMPVPSLLSETEFGSNTIIILELKQPKWNFRSKYCKEMWSYNMRRN